MKTTRLSTNKGFKEQVEDLQRQIRELDARISLHRAANHGVEVKQFESLRLGFVKQLLTLLINSKLNLSEPQTFPLVYRLLENFYPESIRLGSRTAECLEIESVLLPFPYANAFAQQQVAMVAEPDEEYGKSAGAATP